MDIATLAASVTSILVPAIPDLVKGGGKESEVIGEQPGTGVWEAARAIWQRLGSHPLIEPVARDIAAAPDDQDAQAALCHQLKKIMAAEFY